LREVILSGVKAAKVGETQSKDPVPMRLTLTAKNEFNTCFPFEHRAFELERDPSTPGLVPRPCAQDDGGLAISNCIVTAEIAHPGGYGLPLVLTLIWAG
jgi:hypothetical protein